MTPIVGLPLIKQAMETPNEGYPWTKLVVPSKGSIIHKYSDLFLSEPLSSAKILCVGKVERI